MCPAIKGRGQDHLRLNVTDAMGRERVFGLIGSIRAEAQRSGTGSPTSPRAATDVSFWKRRARRWRREFFERLHSRRRAIRGKMTGLFLASSGFLRMFAIA